VFYSKSTEPKLACSHVATFRPMRWKQSLVAPLKLITCKVLDALNSNFSEEHFCKFWLQKT